jgi:hypothetical protein
VTEPSGRMPPDHDPAAGHHAGPWALAAGAYLALVSPLFRSALLHGRILYERDLTMSWLPQISTIVHCVARGALPLWDPFSGFGRPLLADARAGVLYPPTWLNLLAPPSVSILTLSIFHLVLAALGTYVLARRLGTSAMGAFVAGGLWAVTGPLPSLVNQWHNLAAVAWLPWILLTAKMALEGCGFWPLLAWGGAVAVQTLAGGPDYSAFTIIALFLFLLLGMPWRVSATEWRRRLWRCAAAAGLAAGLSAPQWMTTLESAMASQRPSLPWGIRTTWSLPPLGLVETALPIHWADLPVSPTIVAAATGSRAPLLVSVYLGLPCLLLALLGLMSRRGYRAFWVALLIVTLGFSLGRYGPLYDPLVWAFPLFRLLRFPVKAMVVSALAVCMLAGAGYDVLLKGGWPRWLRRSYVAAAAALALGAGVLATVVLVVARSLPEFRPWPVEGSLLASAGLAILAAFWPAVAERRNPWMIWALIAAPTLAAPLVAHRDLIPTAPPELWQVRPPVLSAIGALDRARVYSYDYTLVNPRQLETEGDLRRAWHLAVVPRGWSSRAASMLGMVLSLRSPLAARWRLRGSYDLDTVGFDPAGALTYEYLIREREDSWVHLRLLRMGAVTHAIARLPAPCWQDLVPVGVFPDVFSFPARLYRVPDPLPRAYVVNGARIAAGNMEATAVIDDPSFDPGREIILPEGSRRAPSPGRAGQAHFERYEPDHVRVRAQLDRPGYVVLVERYDAGWRARLDGRPVRLLCANLAFRAVAAPAGTHVVDMEYRPRGVLIGSLAWAGALLVVAAMTVVEVRRRQT